MSIWFRLLLLTSCSCLLACRAGKNQQNTAKKGIAPITVAFYNVENLFDTVDNPDKIDEDFTPDGRYKWTDAIFHQKCVNLARAISSIGTNGPDLLGLAEVENQEVVEMLLKTPPLNTRNYAIKHAESPDMRGIDNAFVYDADIFQEVEMEAIEIDFPTEPDYTSRKILVVSGLWNKKPLHILVNHWPSRRGGAKESESRRMRAATVARQAVDRILAADPKADIIVMGDLNDDPFDRSVAETMNARAVAEDLPDGALFNATYALHNPDDTGTLTYRGKWNLFDQMLLSGGLLNPKGAIHYKAGSIQIHRPEFMQVGGDGRAKDMPRRAIYRGEFQERGFSDHFPVYLELTY